MQKQNVARYPFFRRILFPYSGEEPLSVRQSLRVMLAWILLFPLAMSLGTLGFTALLALPLSEMAGFCLFAFLSGVFIFGCLGLLIVNMSNRAARFRQARRAGKINNNPWR